MNTLHTPYLFDNAGLTQNSGTILVIIFSNLGLQH